MAAEPRPDLPAFLRRSFERSAKEGCAVRRLIVVVDLPEPDPGSNARGVDLTYHVFRAEDIMDDPGLLGAVAQYAVRGHDA